MDDLRPRWAHHALDYSILANPDTLRQMVDGGMTDVQIGEAAGCHEDTVARKRLAVGVKRPNGKTTARKNKPRVPDKCRPTCEGWEDCLDDDRPCMYAAEVS